MICHGVDRTAASGVPDIHHEITARHRRQTITDGEERVESARPPAIDPRVAAGTANRDARTKAADSVDDNAVETVPFQHDHHTRGKRGDCFACASQVTETFLCDRERYGY